MIGWSETWQQAWWQFSAKCLQHVPVRTTEHRNKLKQFDCSMDQPMPRPLSCLILSCRGNDQEQLLAVGVQSRSCSCCVNSIFSLDIRLEARNPGEEILVGQCSTASTVKSHWLIPLLSLWEIAETRADYPLQLISWLLWTAKPWDHMLCKVVSLHTRSLSLKLRSVQLASSRLGSFNCL